MGRIIAIRFYKKLTTACTNESREENKFFKHMLGNMDGLLYNYCKLKYLWSYFDKETISPGHERFSNDYGEFEFGLEVYGKNDSDSALYEDEAFFFCLINKADARGMWSEYCNDEQSGVCIGYDFKRPNYRYPDFVIAPEFVIDDEPHNPLTTFNKKSKSDIWPFAFEILQIDSEGDCKNPLAEKNNDSLMYFAGPKHVVYTYRKKDVDNDDNELGAKVPDPNNPSTRYAFSAIQESLHSLRNNERLARIIHYIKHHTFSEEEEYRILFHFKKTNFEFLKLRSKQGSKDAIKVAQLPMKSFFSYSNSELGRNPRLIVKCRLAVDGVFRTEFGGGNDNCCRYLAIDSRKNTANSSTQIKEKLIVRKRSTSERDKKVKWSTPEKFISKVETELSKLGEWFSDPPKGLKHRYIILGQGDDQKDIYYALDEYLKRRGIRENFKIWCNGHPPIRHIIVERRENTDAIVESIKRYCSHVWWLRDIDVVASAIPHRKSRAKSDLNDSGKL